MSNNLFRVAFSAKKEPSRGSIFEHDPRAIEGVGTFESIRNRQGEIILTLSGIYAAFLVGRRSKPAVTATLPWYEQIRDELLFDDDKVTPEVSSEGLFENDKEELLPSIGRTATEAILHNQEEYALAA